MIYSEAPFPRPSFLEFSKRFDVRFYTSSIDKFLQAKIVFEKFGLPLQQAQITPELYENYEGGKEQLLVKTIEDIKKTIGSNFIFFVEDTSLRIDALSEGEKDYPGLAVKEWFKAITFRELHAQLPSDLERRAATVKSGIALHIPGLLNPVFFFGETQGTVATTPPCFQANPIYPWLTPDNFNGWFVPQGATQRLGEMSFDTAWQYDFRVRSLTALLLRLEEYSAILNIPQSCFTVLPKFNPSISTLELFRNTNQAFLVIGKTCSGKTTFGHISKDLIPDVAVIEASDVIKTFRKIGDVDESDLSFAERILREQGPDAVARRLVQMYRINETSKFIITGFRTIEELEYLYQAVPHLKVILVEASDKIRYARFLKRRRGPILDFESFVGHDTAQWKLGLLPVAQDFADIRIVNEGTEADYERQVLSVVSNNSTDTYPGISIGRPRHRLSTHRLFRCLSILDESGSAMTCEEIEILTRSKSKSHNPLESERPASSSRRPKTIVRNNVNKVLKLAPGLAARFESEFEADLVRYRITDAGRAYLRLMRKLNNH